jgi:uncharacterized membrane protein
MIDVPPSPFSIPEPLHPAIVHFPIALTFIAAGLSILSLLTKRFAIPQYTTLSLILAAITAQLAILAGINQPEIAHYLRPELQVPFHEHSVWGERLRSVLLAAAGLSIFPLIVTRWSSLRRAFAFLCMVTTFGAVYCVIETGEHGANLVYQHGIAVRSNDWRKPPAHPEPTTSAPSEPAPTPAPPLSRSHGSD